MASENIFLQVANFFFAASFFRTLLSNVASIFFPEVSVLRLESRKQIKVGFQATIGPQLNQSSPRTLPCQIQGGGVL